MQSYLEQLGLDVHVINYKSQGFTEREQQCFILPHDAIGTERNKEKMSRFWKAHEKLNMTERMYTEEELAAHSFDNVVIGSDEVWNFSTELIGYDPVYFSRSLNADRIISYAPSFGCVNAGDPIPAEVREQLQRLDSVAVRDVNSSRIMEGITGRPVPVVLDPTFLVDLSDQAVLPDDDGYILVYGFFTQPMIDSIRRYADQSGKRTVAVGYRQDWCDESRDVISPFEWLGYFRNCDCVVTTMFHGMIYSILNQKRFCMYVTDYRRNKLGTLLKDIGFDSRAVDETANLEGVLEAACDYDKAMAVIDEKRAYSKQFLNRALGL
jgi:polysaccharide pyruvyl transferase WcaK-like protein